MGLGIYLHLADLLLLKTTLDLEEIGVDRGSSTVHNWMQKSDLQPTPTRQPAHVALDEAEIQVTDQRVWLYAAVDPATNAFLHFGLYVTRIQALTERFLRELRQHHDVNGATFLVDSAIWLQAGLHHHGLHFREQTHCRRNSTERIFKEVKRRTIQFANHFRNGEPTTLEIGCRRSRTAGTS